MFGNYRWICLRESFQLGYANVFGCPIDRETSFSRVWKCVMFIEFMPLCQWRLGKSHWNRHLIENLITLRPYVIWQIVTYYLRNVLVLSWPNVCIIFLIMFYFVIFINSYYIMYVSHMSKTTTWCHECACMHASVCACVHASVIV